MNLEEEIGKLTAKWYRVISRDHHKDCDCHFYIEAIWSYGDRPRFVPRHYGYLVGQDAFETGLPEKAKAGGLPQVGFKTFDEALFWLRERIQKMIRDEDEKAS